ncbi:MAG: glucose-6-phosphate dehydrogenase assembly protein OpcA [Coraliomargaritaceae bacterium]
MPELIDALPGIALPVEEVTRRLDTMWAGDASEQSPSEFRASQMNVVLHFGKDVDPVDARSRFDGLIRFAQRYPSRIIVLCPRDTGSGAMTAKLFSQCYIGSTHREMCCCEALFLSYQPEDFGYLSNQVSTWLEGDLPTYHWFSGVPDQRIEGYFDNLLSGVRRCVFDGSIESANLADLNWPDPHRVYDLAKARILPVRQSIGQYLSGYSMETLCCGLERVEIHHVHSFRGEAAAIGAWVLGCLSHHKENPDAQRLQPSLEILPCQANESTSKPSLSMTWIFSNENSFQWTMYEEGSRGQINSVFNQRSEKLSMHVRLLPLENALAEALFF